MAEFADNFVSLLQYLLPGFLAAWVFYGFTSFTKPPQFERLIQALILTYIIQVLVVGEREALLVLGNHFSISAWTNETASVASFVTAIMIGLLFSFGANSNFFHGMVRVMGITQETSYPSEWFGTFLKKVTFIVLHFEDGRRLYGWPREWPSDPDKGQFLLEQAAWLDGTKVIELTGVDTILIDVSDVRWVEFMDMEDIKNNGKESIKPAAATSP